MLLVVITLDNIKFWENAKVDFVPHGIDVLIYQPLEEADLPNIASSVHSVLAKSDKPALILCSIPQVIRLLPPALVIPISSLSAPAFPSFIKATISALYRSLPFPSVFVGLPEGWAAPFIDFCNEWGFPTVGSSHDADFIFTNMPARPEHKNIIIPTARTLNSFLDFMTELMYSFVHPAVVKDKSFAEMEISRLIWESITRKRKGK